MRNFNRQLQHLNKEIQKMIEILNGRKPIPHNDLLRLLKEVIYFTENQQLLQESTYKTIFYGIGDAVIITNAFCKIQMINPAAERLSGWSSFEANGKDIDKVFRLVDEKNKKPFIYPYGEILEKGKTVTIERHCLLHTREGTFIPIKDKGAPLYEENGKISGMVIVFSDFTRTRENEQEIERSKGYIQSIVDTVSDSLLILDSDLMVLNANNSFYNLFKLSKNVVEGKHIFTLDGGRWNISELKDLLEKVSREDTIFKDYEITFESNDETSYNLLLNARRIHSDSNTRILILLSIQNITEVYLSKRMSKILEMEIETRTADLNTANVDLEAFSYFVSHDLRAPLRHITGYINLLKRDFPQQISEKSTHYMETITESAQRMSQLIEGLLEYSRIGKKSIHKYMTSMNDITNEIINVLKNETKGRSIEFKKNNLPFVYCDKMLMELVWLNLLSNAVKFTQNVTLAKIEIGFTENETEFMFFISDNGVGFEMKYAKKLFEVFQRLHSSKEFHGTGIGLAHVRRIIRKHGGRVWAESKPLKGTSIYFTIPKQENKNDKQA